ncbi:hypothetical protein SAMN05216241_10646 [Limimonas halophila]|uniref:Uncharacterized protein n=1 Tax=Limimonas halophila TaxID=1082479 RepID=A0A1G7RY76_9PROT|nr:hypothetical protein [Limimonas halophila]SDG15717.1 hypothetical protein SAMN05216241_10646 [Limimonas halophila]
MTWGLTESHRARKRRRRWAVVKWVLILVGLIGAGAFAYATGAKLARIEVRELEEQVAELQRRLDEQAQENARLRRELEATENQLTTWKQRYEQNVPEGEPAELLKLLRARLNNGVPADRLEFLVESASVEPECPGGPVTKRFIVQTPLSSGAASSVSFAGNTVTVTATGQPATDAQGQPQAWFDPAAPITATFTRLGGESQSAEGRLPVHHAMVVDGQEHRFSIVEGDDRAFAKVTWRRCDYP